MGPDAPLVDAVARGRPLRTSTGRSKDTSPSAGSPIRCGDIRAFAGNEKSLWRRNIGDGEFQGLGIIRH